VRRDHDGIRRYVHLATGNYNPTTAKLYTDLSFFTCRRDFGEDASALFNLLTGYSQGHDWNKLVIAPAHLADQIEALIHRERVHAEAGLPARIIAKMNSLVDPGAIEALYAASQAGVRIDLVIRGICCLRPGVPGVSDNIRVTSIVDRFLEHSRIAFFQNNDRPEVFLSSADWMPRNFRRRVETMFPIEDPRLQNRIVEGILGVVLSDNVKARVLGPDAVYRRLPPPKPGEAVIRSQVEFQNMARELSSKAPIRTVTGPSLIPSAFRSFGMP
jgi:polyphosphate kinase